MYTFVYYVKNFHFVKREWEELKWRVFQSWEREQNEMETDNGYEGSEEEEESSQSEDEDSPHDDDFASGDDEDDGG